MDDLNGFLNYFGSAFYVRTSFLVFHLTERYKIVGCQSSLSTRRHENNNRFAITELLDVIESRFIHGCHTRAIMLLAKAFEMNLYGDRSYCGPEIEETELISAKPFSNVRSISHCSRQAYHSYFIFFIHSRDNDFNDGTTILAEQMDFIKNYKSNLPCILPFFASSYSIPFFWSSHYDICLTKGLNVRCKVTTELYHRFFNCLESRDPVF